MNLRRSRIEAAVIATTLLSTVASTDLLAIPIIEYPSYGVELFAANVGSPSGMAQGAGGELYFTDYAGGRILRITNPNSPGLHAYDVVASGIPYPTDVAVGSDGKVFVASSVGPSSQILQVLNDGRTLAFATGFSYPTSLVSEGNYLYVANSGDGTISKVDATTGARSIYVSGLSAPHGAFGMAMNSSGELFLIDHGTGAIFVADRSGSLRSIGAVSPLGGTAIAVNASGSLFVSDVLLGTLNLLDESGAHVFASGFAGKANPPFNGPGDLLLLDAHTLLVGDGTSIWRISSASTLPEPGSLAMTSFIIGLALACTRRSYGSGESLRRGRKLVAKTDRQCSRIREPV